LQEPKNNLTFAVPKQTGATKTGSARRPERLKEGREAAGIISKYFLRK